MFLLLERMEMLGTVPVRWPHRGSVAKSSVEGFGVWIEKVLYVRQTLDLKLLWFLLYHLPARHNMTSNIQTEM